MRADHHGGRGRGRGSGKAMVVFMVIVVIVVFIRSKRDGWRQGVDVYVYGGGERAHL